LNKQAAILENVFFPAQVLEAFSLGDNASITGVRLFLARFREEAGQAQDAVEKILLDQLIVAHLKVGELYALAATTPKLEFKQLYGNAATRLLVVICHLVSTLASYRTSIRPKAGSGKSLKGTKRAAVGREPKQKPPTAKGKAASELANE
jgi:hypothetical protein